MGSLVPAARVWQDVVADKRQRRAESIARFVQADRTSTAKRGEQIIVDSASASMGVDEIVACLTRHEFTCEELVMSHIQQVCVTHDATNCLTEVCFEDAIVSAKKLDDYLTHHGTAFGPLHGIPITLKDQFNVKGYDTTLGYVGRAMCPAKADAVLVKMLRSLGAVVLAKTNIPQSIMWCETDNPLWGLTTNPYDPKYTPGGSTGGEAVLIARGASMLGFGTDLGGSIRIPSHMMGIYGLRPSSSRLPYEGVPVSTEGQEHVPSSVGPMAARLDTIYRSMKSIISLKPWEYDARCDPIPWREAAYEEALSRPLVFGVLFDDGVARPHPPVTRVLRQAVDALRAAGHAVIEWNADLHEDCIRLMDEFYTADGGQDIRAAVSAGGEPFIPYVEKLINRGKPISVYEYWQLNRRKWALQSAYLEKWNSIRTHDGRLVDAILMPPMPHTAVPHGSCRWVGYTKVWNLLDYTALVVPGGNAAEEDLHAPWDYEPRGDMDKWCLRLWGEKDDMTRLKLPVGVQIVGRKLEEEKVLGIGKVVDDVLRSVRADAHVALGADHC